MEIVTKIIKKSTKNEFKFASLNFHFYTHTCAHVKIFSLLIVLVTKQFVKNYPKEQESYEIIFTLLISCNFKVL